MIYRDHGLGSHVTSYDHYFGGNIDEDALAYLTLANSLIHELRPDAITIAEEVSALPGLAAPTSMKGVGFDFRLAMGVPDYWIKLLKHVPDEQWRVSDLWAELTSKRPEEKTIQYCESHDQALVGDKSIMFWLADKEMYWHMQIDDHNHVIDRAIALHKLIRLLTLSLGGDGYLTFMGNEFGHPEWVDFPREGNGWSYHYARRQWSLRDNNRLKYAYLAEFDRELMMLDEQYGVLAGGQPQKVYEHVDDMILGYQRAGLLFVCNLHPTRSCEDRAIPGAAEEYTVVLDSNDAVFGGSARSLERTIRPDPKSAQVHLSLPSRTALVLKPRA
jgi:1,4-alpha-glucan branching enzyme